MAEGERVLLDLRPCVIAFLLLYLPSLYLLLLAIFLLFGKGSLPTLIPSLLQGWTGLYGFYLLLSFLILGPAVAYSLIQLSLRPTIYGFLSLLGAVATKHVALGIPWSFEANDSLREWLASNAELLLLITVGFVGILSTEVYRRSHRYIVTNVRLYLRSGVISCNERILPLSKVNDLALIQGWLGKLLNYGTLIPLTASGMGLGSNYALLAGSTIQRCPSSLAVGITIAGGRNIQVPKPKPFNSIFGVCNAPGVSQKIMCLIASRELQA